MKTVGGQAVIEGVMMKSRNGWAVAVRDKQGVIHLKKEPLAKMPYLFKLPVVRGFIALFHALSLGIRALEYSAGKAYEGTDEKPLTKSAMAITIASSIGLGIGLFILLPLYATKLIGMALSAVAEQSLLFNLVDGLVRVVVFLLYILVIGLWSEMRRVFEYHGAEHKVIHAFEEGRELTPQSAKQYSPLHPRCGTSFLLIVMVMSILVFSFVPQSWHFIYKFLSRLVLIPLIAGLSFELLKLSAKMSENPIIRLMIYPGLMLQRLTTREPDESQLEVAIAALKGLEEFDTTENPADAR